MTMNVVFFCHGALGSSPETSNANRYQEKSHTMQSRNRFVSSTKNLSDNFKILPEVGERGKVNITQLVVLNMIQMQSMLFINSFRKGSIFIKNLAYTYKLITRMKVYW